MSESCHQHRFSKRIVSWCLNLNDPAGVWESRSRAATLHALSHVCQAHKKPKSRHVAGKLFQKRGIVSRATRAATGSSGYPSCKLKQDEQKHGHYSSCSVHLWRRQKRSYTPLRARCQAANLFSHLQTRKLSVCPAAMQIFDAFT
jgi:hypothetical protein